ncbi:hypothetical protein BDW74DRAFT_183681 [Aspergillus multicolor]|uniref:EthD domain-containing protein n=1 Tax=Aspergillus multicolor TaxID=41759 RepID=UPI003CCDC4C4
MPFKALLFLARKPDLTPTQFRAHYETVHVPLIKRLAGSDFPLSHRRMYLARLEGKDDTYPAVVLAGTQEDFDFDCVTELTFVDEDAFKTFFGRRMEAGIKEAVDRDEGEFLDAGRLKLVVLGGVEETISEGEGAQ